MLFGEAVAYNFRTRKCTPGHFLFAESQGRPVSVGLAWLVPLMGAVLDPEKGTRVQPSRDNCYLF